MTYFKFNDSEIAVLKNTLCSRSGIQYLKDKILRKLLIWIGWKYTPVKIYTGHMFISIY